MIDSHCHIEDEKYAADRDELVLKWKKELDFVVSAAVEPKDYELALEIHKKHPDFVYLTMGVHPGIIDKLSDGQVENAIELIKNNRDNIVAIGEVGLDYLWIKDEKGRERQKEVFVKFIKLVKELDLPVVVHIRAGEDKKENDPYLEAIEILGREEAKRVLLHMFGAKRFLQRVLGNGWYISTNAIVLTGKEHNRIVRAVPLDRLLLETDSPYLVPEPEKSEGIKRNEPIFVRRVAERVAKIKEIDLKKVVDQTTQNARKFFALYFSL